MLLLIAFSLVFLVQSYFYLFFFRKYTSYQPSRNLTETFSVSVVVCAKNEAENLLKSKDDFIVQFYKKSRKAIGEIKRNGEQLSSFQFNNNENHPTNLPNASVKASFLWLLVMLLINRNFINTITFKWNKSIGWRWKN